MTNHLTSQGPDDDPLPTPVVRWRPERAGRPAALVVALHGRGADETTMDALTDPLPDRLAVAAVRAPLREGQGWAWFANRGIGRPVPASLARTLAWLQEWIDHAWSGPTYLLGFSGGAAAAGGLLLHDPSRFAGAALLSGTLPFDAGLPTADSRLAGLPVFHGHGAQDQVIPAELVERTTGYLTGPSAAETTEWRYRALGHTINAEMCDDVRQWFDAHTPGRPLPGTGAAPLPLPARPGPRPRVWQGIPQTQLDQPSPPGTRERLLAHAAALPGVRLGQSVISVPGATGLLLDPARRNPDPETFIVPAAGEFAHLHPRRDGSLHLTLPPAQSAEVIRHGWGELHPFAGGRLSRSMVLLYAPRDDDETTQVERLIDLAHTAAHRAAPTPKGR